MLGVFDIFKIGIGPSSSHTFGPMIAARQFLERLGDARNRIPGAGAPSRIVVSLHGSLAFTGKGHASDLAICYGLMGFLPADFDAEKAAASLAELISKKSLSHPSLGELRFDPKTDLIFDYETSLPHHANGMVFRAEDAAANLALREEIYSIGGGFILDGAAIEAGETGVPEQSGNPPPFPFENAAALLEICASETLSIAEIMRQNELANMSEAELDAGLKKIWAAMHSSIERGLKTEGVLPGGLNIKRRAPSILAKLEAERGANLAAPHLINNRIALYAMAVNEENAAGGRIVTAPTNGAAGVIPAVIHYWLNHVPDASMSGVGEFLLTASAIGAIIKRNASISGAECGCQAEIGSASAMAAAGLAAMLGGTPAQIENAAEIALEHHLGMTCDPVKGLVQVPCIERNGLGAIKAVSAASLSLCGDGSHFMPLDNCIETMRQTGRDMDTRYKETSLGGLAVNHPEC